mgnify:CR=1 FL=1
MSSNRYVSQLHKCKDSTFFTIFVLEAENPVPIADLDKVFVLYPLVTSPDIFILKFSLAPYAQP